MQEEVTGKSVALIVDGARMSEQVLEKAINAYLAAQKNKQPKIYRGKQSLKHLSQQNAGLVSIEISDKNIKAFTQVAKKYHVDFALKKDTTAEQPRYLVFFKSRDADAITAAFQEFTAEKLHRKPSIRKRLALAKEQVRKQHRELDREKVSPEIRCCALSVAAEAIKQRTDNRIYLYTFMIPYIYFLNVPVCASKMRSFTKKPSI